MLHVVRNAFSPSGYFRSRFIAHASPPYSLNRTKFGKLERYLFEVCGTPEGPSADGKTAIPAATEDYRVSTSHAHHWAVRSHFTALDRAIHAFLRPHSYRSSFHLVSTFSKAPAAVSVATKICHSFHSVHGIYPVHHRKGERDEAQEHKNADGVFHLECVPLLVMFMKVGQLK